MHFLLPILFRLLPLALPLLALATAVVVDSSLDRFCTGKSVVPCFAFGIGIGPYLGEMFWFGVLLWPPGLLWSAELLNRFLGDRLPSPWGKKKTASPD